MSESGSEIEVSSLRSEPPVAPWATWPMTLRSAGDLFASGEVERLESGGVVKATFAECRGTNSEKSSLKISSRSIFNSWFNWPEPLNCTRRGPSQISLRESGLATDGDLPDSRCRSGIGYWQPDNLLWGRLYPAEEPQE